MNYWTTNTILMGFLGMFSAYLITAISYNAKELPTYFGFVFNRVDLDGSTLFSRNFSNFGIILKHNVLVSLVIIVLCFLYRSHAALLTLGWNASIWVIVSVRLTQNALHSDPSVSMTVPILIFCSVTPNLITEGAAYIMIALSSIW